MFRNIAIFSSREKSFSWWWLGIKVGVVTALVIWWWLENQKEQFLRETSSKGPQDDPQSIPLPEEEPDPGEEIPIAETTQAKPSAPPPTELDDLTVIEGIGPKISATLEEAGIRTFAQLAASKPPVLKGILLDAGIRIAFPDTWPQQAALAAKADWTALEELQSSLQGGRRTG